MSAMTTGYLLLGLLLDRRFGDPARLWSRIPHPVEIFGQLITFAERRLNGGGNPKAAGTVFMLLVCAGFFAIGWFAARLPFGGFLEILAAFVLLAAEKPGGPCVRCGARPPHWNCTRPPGSVADCWP